jgi:hypothetical protein
MQSRMLEYQCLFGIRAVEVPLFVCLHSCYNQVTEVVETVKLVRLTLNALMQNGGDSVDVIVL